MTFEPLQGVSMCRTKAVTCVFCGEIIGYQTIFLLSTGNEDMSEIQWIDSGARETKEGHVCGGCFMFIDSGVLKEV